MMDLKTRIRWLLFPGMNLHARERYQVIPSYFADNTEHRDLLVLDAGFGNGMLSYKSYLRGRRVIGISIKDDEVDKGRWLFNEYLSIPNTELDFKRCNLYEFDYANESFDEIICTEVLEHIKDDSFICEKFWLMLKPGGVLHVCAPNAEHPYNRSFPLDYEESGGHVRPGYTLEQYRNLFEPLGFHIETVRGMGGAVRQTFNRMIKNIQHRFGVIAGLPIFFIALVILLFEGNDKYIRDPFSIYVRVRKPTQTN